MDKGTPGEIPLDIAEGAVTKETSETASSVNTRDEIPKETLRCGDGDGLMYHHDNIPLMSYKSAGLSGPSQQSIATFSTDTTASLPDKQRAGEGTSPHGKASAHKKKSGWKKPADMPKRPLSAYNLFFADERKRLQQSGKLDKGELGFGGLARTVAEKWKQLDPELKEGYTQIAEKGREEYRAKMKIYREKVALQQRKEESEQQRRDAILESKSFHGFTQGTFHQSLRSIASAPAAAAPFHQPGNFATFPFAAMSLPQLQHIQDAVNPLTVPDMNAILSASSGNALNPEFALHVQARLQQSQSEQSSDQYAMMAQAQANLGGNTTSILPVYASQARQPANLLANAQAPTAHLSVLPVRAPTFDAAAYLTSQQLNSDSQRSNASAPVPLPATFQPRPTPLTDNPALMEDLRNKLDADAIDFLAGLQDDFAEDLLDESSP